MELDLIIVFDLIILLLLFFFSYFTTVLIFVGAIKGVKIIWDEDILHTLAVLYLALSHSCTALGM